MSEPIPPNPPIGEDDGPPVEQNPDEPVIPVDDFVGWNESDVVGERVKVEYSPVIAGDPTGARVEVAADGLHAYNAANVETATIRGDEGVFVGGEFRTSDTLPGQVTLSDTAAQGKPGLSVEPENAGGYDVIPSIGPDGAEMHVRGGVGTDGAMSGAAFGPGGVSIYQNGPGATGTGSWADVNEDEVKLATRPDRTNAQYEGAVWVRPTGVAIYTEGTSGIATVSAQANGDPVTDGGVIGYRAPGISVYTALIRAGVAQAQVIYGPPGTRKAQLSIDANGIWVGREKTADGGNFLNYNLEETAQDSGWQAITPASGITGAGSPGWRNKGGVVWMRGQLTLASGSWAAGWTTLCTLPAEASPATALRRPAAIPGTGGAVLQVGSTGVVQVYLPVTLTGATEMHLGGLFFPLG